MLRLDDSERTSSKQAKCMDCNANYSLIFDGAYSYDTMDVCSV